MRRIPERTIRELGWQRLLDQLRDRCATDSGRRLLATNHFQTSAEDVEEMLALVSEARRLIQDATPLPFGGIVGLDQAIARLRKDGVLETRVLQDIGRTLRAFGRLHGFLAEIGSESPLLSARTRLLHDLDHVYGPIEDSFESDGRLADHASPNLGKFRRRVHDLNEQLTKRMRQLLDSAEVQRYLQDRFYTQRENRYVLPVRADCAGSIEGIVHGSSASGATLFVEPKALVELNNRLKVAESDVESEELRIIRQLCSYVAHEVEAIEQDDLVVAELDGVHARARLAQQMDATRPMIAADAALALNAARHPLMVLDQVPVVANDIELAPAKTLVLSGPNAGGKTVALKTCGLMALMLRAGCHLPVGPESRLPLYAGVHTAIDDDQSIERNLSTFTAQIAQVLTILADADQHTLVLIDELTTGTDPGEGAALAQAILEQLASRHPQVIVTTHYERLKALAINDDRFVNGSVGFDLDNIAPTYSLDIGLPGSSCALEVAQRTGLPPGIVERGRELLGPTEQQLSALLTELTTERRQLQQRLEDLRAAEQLARTRANELESKRRQLKERAQAEHAAQYENTLRELQLARRDIVAARRALKQHAPDSTALRSVERDLSRAAEKLNAAAPEPAQIATPPLDTNALRPGDQAYVRSLGGNAIIESIDQRGRVTVRAGIARAAVDLDELFEPLRGEATVKRLAPPLRPAARPDPANEAPKIERTIDTTLDLRGHRAEEALRMSDHFIDQALLAGRDAIFLLHGRGSGALRRVIREHLASHVAVQRFDLAEERDGGDAVTVVWLR
ncbi:MAG: endonuclease MutS2 [Deltaproteobacteria bacterium]|nr:endonuclease MutS2 [Deltaproteobacteria bacterium]